MEWPGYLDEYQKLVNRINTPRVVIDNAVCATATLIKVDSLRKHKILLEAIQVLTDLNLSIHKAYISSDGRWFMNVFHVTDHYGHKLTDDSLLSYIEQSLARTDTSIRGSFADGLTSLELTGGDRPGLISEIFAVLYNLQTNVVEARVWAHNGRIASLIALDPIEDHQTISNIELRLLNMLKGGDNIRTSRVTVAVTSQLTSTHLDRRLHQMMSGDRDYVLPEWSQPPSVSVQNWIDRGYSIVNIQCHDRLKLLFDVVCSISDMDYLIFHGTIGTCGDKASQEFYIKHSDGTPISSEAERQRVIQCLQAAIERRSSELTSHCVRLELFKPNTPGLLSDVTRTLRENSLSVSRAEIKTEGDMTIAVFYVTEASGGPADRKTIEVVRERIGNSWFKVDKSPVKGDRPEAGAGGGNGLFSFGSLVRRNLSYFGLIKSCS